MKIKKVRGSNQKLCKLAFNGDMTIYTAEAIHEQFKTHLEKSSNFDLTLKGVEEIDSTGLQLLLAIKRHTETAGGSLTLTMSSAPVLEILELFNVSQRFDMAAV